jgi:hypothetical protein
MGMNERANPRERAVGVSRTKGVGVGVEDAIDAVEKGSRSSSVLWWCPLQGSATSLSALFVVESLVLQRGTMVFEFLLTRRGLDNCFVYRRYLGLNSLELFGGTQMLKWSSVQWEF